MAPSWKRFVALGDSLTEGWCDPVLGQAEPWLGWADRLAMILDGNASLRGTDFSYANLAVRGRRVRHVIDEQVPRAIELRADLVSILIGGNDLMAPSADPDLLAGELERGVEALRTRGIDVLLATCFDPRFAFFLKPLRGRAAVYNANLWSIARRHRTYTLDLWGVRELQLSRMWAEDRLHLGPEGHRLLAIRAAHSLGIPYAEVAPRATAIPAQSRGARPLTLATWTQRYAAPWVARRIRGVSSGDGRGPKLPHLMRVAGRH